MSVQGQSRSRWEKDVWSTVHSSVYAYRYGWISVQTVQPTGPNRDPKFRVSKFRKAIFLILLNSRKWKKGSKGQCLGHISIEHGPKICTSRAGCSVKRLKVAEVNVQMEDCTSCEIPLNAGHVSVSGRWHVQFRQGELLSPVYTTQPVVKPVVNPVWQTGKCLYTRTTGCHFRCQTGCLTTGCIMYTIIQPVAWQTAVSCIQPVVKPVVKPGCTTGLTTGLPTVLNEQSVRSTFVQHGCQTLFLKPVVQPVWQPVVSCKRGFTKLTVTGVNSNNEGPRPYLLSLSFLAA